MNKIQQEGYDAGKEGKSEAACPYPSNNKRKKLNQDRYDWMSGYCFFQTQSNLKAKGFNLTWED